MKVEINRHSNNTTTVFFDDVDVSANIYALSIYIAPGGRMEVTAEYACHEQSKITGDADVIHVCPKGGRKQKSGIELNYQTRGNEESLT